MEMKMDHCIECDRVIASDSTRNVCDVCFDIYDQDRSLIEDTIAVHGNLSATEISEMVHLSVKRVERLLTHLEPTEKESTSGESCEKCKLRPRLANAKLCLTCQLAMFKSLGDEVNHAAHNNIKAYEKPDSSIGSLRDTMEIKRDRGGFNKMTPNTSVKGNNKR
jgi:hypothetical protein